jgi:hypothetical protein
VEVELTKIHEPVADWAAATSSIRICRHPQRRLPALASAVTLGGGVEVQRRATRLPLAPSASCTW